MCEEGNEEGIHVGNLALLQSLSQRRLRRTAVEPRSTVRNEEWERHAQEALDKYLGGKTKLHGPGMLGLQVCFLQVCSEPLTNTYFQIHHKLILW